jgi:hypothetical protein
MGSDFDPLGLFSNEKKITTDFDPLGLFREKKEVKTSNFDPLGLFKDEKIPQAKEFPSGVGAGIDPFAPEQPTTQKGELNKLMEAMKKQELEDPAYKEPIGDDSLLTVKEFVKKEKARQDEITQGIMETPIIPKSKSKFLDTGMVFGAGATKTLAGFPETIAGTIDTITGSKLRESVEKLTTPTKELMDKLIKTRNLSKLNKVMSEGGGSLLAQWVPLGWATKLLGTVQGLGVFSAIQSFAEKEPNFIKKLAKTATAYGSGVSMGKLSKLTEYIKNTLPRTVAEGLGFASIGQLEKAITPVVDKGEVKGFIKNLTTIDEHTFEKLFMGGAFGFLKNPKVKPEPPKDWAQDIKITDPLSPTIPGVKLYQKHVRGKETLSQKELQKIDTMEPPKEFKPEPIPEMFSNPSAKPKEVMFEKAKLKDQISEAINRGYIEEGTAVRFKDTDYLKKLIETGQLPEGISFEGEGGISATELAKGRPIPAYGDNTKHSVAIIAPKEFIAEKGMSANEVLLNPKTPLEKLTFLIDNHKKPYKIDELRKLFKKSTGRVPAQPVGKPEVKTSELYKNTLDKMGIQDQFKEKDFQYQKREARQYKEQIERELSTPEATIEKANNIIQKKSKDLTPDDNTSIGQIVDNIIVKKGDFSEHDFDLAKNLIHKVRPEGTAKGQFIQAFTSYSPETKALRIAEKGINDAQAKNDLAPKAKVKAKKIKKEMDRINGEAINEVINDINVYKELKNAGINLDEVIRKHYIQQEAVKESLVDSLVKRSGLTEDHAVQLADLIKSKFESITTEKKTKALERMFGPNKIKNKSMIQKIIETSNLGGLSDSKYFEHIAERFKIPVLDKAFAEKVIKKAEEIELLEEGSVERLKKENELLTLLKQKAPPGIWRKISTVQLISQLLNPKTIIRNIGGNVLFSLTEGLSKIPQSMADRLMSMKTGQRTSAGWDIKGRSDIKAQMKGFLGERKRAVIDIKEGTDTLRARMEVAHMEAGGKNTNEMLNKLGLKKGAGFGQTEIRSGTFSREGNLFERTLAALERGLGYSMKVTDRMAFMGGYESALNNMMRAAKVNKPTAEMVFTKDIPGHKYCF